MAMNAAIQLQNISFSYRGRRVINDVTLTFRRGAVVSLLGPNGSGKTTLLKIILGLLPPHAGTVLFAGRPLAAYPRQKLAQQMAYVPQVHREAFAYTVADVVLMGRMPYHSFFSTTSAKDMKIAEAAMDRLGILNLKKSPYTEISGGERQLALIARALAQGAETLIMDEPANGLDFGNQIRLLDHIADLARDGYTFVISTHFPDHALWISDHVIMLQKGSVAGEGIPIEVMTEESIFRLYKTEVSIFELGGRLTACVPRSVIRKGLNEAESLHASDMLCRVRGPGAQ